MYASDAQTRLARIDEAVSAAAQQPGLTVGQIVATVFAGYADRPALGERAVEIVTDAVTGCRAARILPSYHTITYGEFATRIAEVAAAWHSDPLPVRPGDRVCVLGFASIDCLTLDLAATHLGAVVVPLQAGAPASQLTPILAETEPRVVATSLAQLPVVVDAVRGADLSAPRLVVYDYHSDDDAQRSTFEAARARLADANSPVTAESLATLRTRGAALPAVPAYAEADGDDLAMLIYTSGSTGTPKGAMHTQRIQRGKWLSGLDNSGDAALDVAAISLHYLPLSHVFGRSTLVGTLVRGGTAYFAARGDMSTLLADFALVRPTRVNLVPRVCDMLFQHYLTELERCGIDSEAARARLRRRVFGERVVTAAIAGAPLTSAMREFMESLLDAELHDLYGSTEAGLLTVDNTVERAQVAEYKLVDVPELGYFTSDRPHPRGELLVKMRNPMPGYFQRPEVTAAVFDDDGFYKTGDIVARIGPDELVYLDRRSNVLKLSQGEFVTVARLEAVYGKCPWIRQIFVYGNSERAFLLAVIVPTAAALAMFGSGNALMTALRKSLAHTAAEAELNSYEIPRDFLVETEPFSVENGLLSGAGKLLRPKLLARYRDRLEERYVTLSESRADELRALRVSAAGLSALESVSRAARALLGVADSELRPDMRFLDLGGDSLSALTFADLLRDVLDIEVPVGFIISPATDLAAIAHYIDAARTLESARPRYASVHGCSDRVRPGDLALDAFIDAETRTAAMDSAHVTGEPRTVLLTGANGYIGRFLCLEWMERLQTIGGTLICLLRGVDSEHARRRLDDVFDTGDAELLDRYRELAAGTLEVITGDVSARYFGLDESKWTDLAQRVDFVVHPAALVNHLLPYRELFGPNVVGTAEIIRLAVTARIKPVVYLSTVAVASDIDPERVAQSEGDDIRDVSPERTLSDARYANGYGNSKWAGEVLLREAHDLCAVPVTVFRANMTLAHSRYAGQLNVPDAFTRLLFSLVATGIAPRSFYAPDDAGRRPHYDGLPVDFTAAAITALGGTDGFRTYHVVNPHDDGRSLDQFVDWLVEAGHSIHRVDDYHEWFARFGTALRSLPEKQRARSILPLLSSYSRPATAVSGSTLPATAFRDAVQRARVGPNGDIPHLERSLIDKYVSDLRLLGLLQPSRQFKTR
ncbi:fatty acid CoA ligase FadD9 [Nocardia tenerifensis]|uniref:Carboxylic acid reductase n=1 Tax=Nocardia tenerifensis TaxID=228006 RepID=A0A318JQK2_9NOCA|nr:fatty acid CoA ligase FadD9 [Nocardia tenerifensis]